MSSSLRITEIFYSLQGEARSVGLPTVFVRLTGCPLRCSYCDTAYAFSGGAQMSLDEVLAQVADWGPSYVCVTGGEPLAQPNCLPLLTSLCDAGYQVSLETSGALSLDGVDSRVSKVMDLKTPSSGEVDRNLYSNLSLLTQHDQLKFVIGSEDDYLWAKAQVQTRDLATKVSDVLFSPSHAEIAPAQLADWILRDRLCVRLQLQLHKYLWADAVGR
jgi:7-carboxy-7-deazaguanine synthase